jgi:TonB family protein
MTNPNRETPSGFSPNRSAIGGPLPAFRALLENGRVSRWRMSLGLLLHGLVVVALLLLPLLLTEHLNGERPRGPVVVIRVAAGQPLGTEHGGPPPTQHEPHPVTGLTAPVHTPVNIDTAGDAPIAEAGFGPGTGVPLGFPEGVEGDVSLPPGPQNVPPPAVRSPAPQQPVRVGGRVRPPKLVRRVEPLYPRLAAEAGIEGRVELEAVIGTDGRVERIEVKSGHPALVRAAVEAARQWVYEPTYLNDQPVPVLLKIVMEFHLRH